MAFKNPLENQAAAAAGCFFAFFLSFVSLFLLLPIFINFTLTDLSDARRLFPRAKKYVLAEAAAAALPAPPPSSQTGWELGQTSQTSIRGCARARARAHASEPLWTTRQPVRAHTH